MSLPTGFLDELRNRVPISRVVGRKVSWDQRKSVPARGDYWAPCPFHQEKTASFHVDDQKGFYYCFGCHAKGDAVSFLRESENMGFMEAVEVLAGEAGVSMPASDPRAAARAAAAQGLAEAMEAAVQFFRLQLSTAGAVQARAYLQRRGLKPETVERFGIGFAPDSRTALQEHLTGKGFALGKLVESGLAGLPRDGRGSPYDRFRNRIMFPIRDLRGRTIAFGARALAPGQEPKYLNSPETPLFDKGRSLYNAAPARAAAGKAGSLIVAEGYMDVIALAEAGMENAVAPLGTAITENQLLLLWRFSPEPVVALDGDRAGLSAAHRLIDLALPLLEPGKALRFAIMPENQDPDEVIRAGGAAAMQALIDASKPMADLLWKRETEGKVFDSPERRAALDARLRSCIGTIRDPRLRRHYGDELAGRRAVLFAPDIPAESRGRRQTRSDSNRKGSGKGIGYRAAAPASPLGQTLNSPLVRGASGEAGTEVRIRECAILAACINNPHAAAEFEDRLERLELSSPDMERIRDRLLSALPSCLSEDNPSVSLGSAIGRHIGRDPLEDLMAHGQIRSNRHLATGADLADAIRAIDEELTRHAAAAGLRAEIRDAERDLSPENAEQVGWRLREATEAGHAAGSIPLAGEDDASTTVQKGISDRLQKLIDRHKGKDTASR